MCGIVGALSFSNSDFRVTEPYLVRMRETMAHRGPDGVGCWIAPDARVGFGFRRLAIIDLSPAANQPMANEDGSVQLVFNGEIYNHAEIRGELQKEGGHCWKTDHSDGEITEHRYWDVLDHAKKLDECDEDLLAARVLEELRTSVRLRKISDVPVGVFLSGGIDSSTNAALFSEGETAPVKTFSIGYVGENASYPNEFHYARRMADLVRADHHELALTVDDLVDFLPTMVRLQDEPIADPVCVPVYYVSKLARDAGVIVAQVGEGADELFYGYSSWRTLYDLQRYDDVPVPRFAKQALAAGIRAAGLHHRRGYEFLRRA